MTVTITQDGAKFAEVIDEFMDAAATALTGNARFNHVSDTAPGRLQCEQGPHTATSASGLQHSSADAGVESHGEGGTKVQNSRDSKPPVLPSSQIGKASNRALVPMLQVLVVRVQVVRVLVRPLVEQQLLLP